MRRCLLSRGLWMLAALLALSSALPAHAQRSELEWCLLTFADTLTRDPSLMGSWAIPCPPHCFRLIAAQQVQQPLVFGSYPYDVLSSVCMSAVHSGVIDETVGGAVLVEWFWPADWSNSSTQTIFPHGSERGSLSNGVQSAAVPAERIPLPANSTDRSFTVWTRGLRLGQRRVAPFSPRSGHLHVHYEPLYAVSILLVMGGRNATHFFNDVFLFFSAESNAGSWRQLPDAPFSPRSDMAVIRDSWDASVPAPAVSGFYIFGGQTEDACGLSELGVCSGELWRAQFTLSGDSIDGASVRWVGVTRLPFLARCGASFSSGWQPLGLRYAIIAGQASYSDPSCLSPPASYNAVWYSYSPANASTWWKGPDAPFSPRRSMEDLRLYGLRALHRSYWDLGIVLAGGVRYVSHRYDPGSASATLTSAVMFSEVWKCELQTMPSDPSTWSRDCVWGVLTNDPVSPIGSLPFPVASTTVDNWGTDTLIIPSGMASDSAIRRWQRTPSPDVAEPFTGPVNVTWQLIVQGEMNRTGSDWPTWAELNEHHFQLPWETWMDEAELNDPHGSFQLGSEWVLSVNTLSFQWEKGMSCAHPQSKALTETPGDPNPFVYQAAPSHNSTRGRFNFAIRRRDHAIPMLLHVDWDRWVDFTVLAMSGGRSGDRYLNDWVNINSALCLPPDDPSYLAVLGPVVPLYNRTIKPQGVKALSPGTELDVACASDDYHWEPEEEGYGVWLLCAANGMWVDPFYFTVRRCVRTALQCPPPLEDLGEGCQLPVPIISRLLVNSPDVVQRDAVTVLNVPPYSTQLTILGSGFVQPLRVTIAGYECLWPELVPDAFNRSSGHVCVNGTARHPTPQCVDYAGEVRCEMPMYFRSKMRVGVESGPDAIVAMAVTERAGQFATVSTAVPVIQAMYSKHCTSLDATSLVDCPVTHPFEIEVDVDVETMDEDSLWFTPQVSLSLSSGVLWLSCSAYERPSSSSLVNTNCTVHPHLGRRYQLQVTSYASQLTSAPAFLSFAECPAGHSTDYDAPADATDLCKPCEAGWSTGNATNQPACTPCRPGQYAPHGGTPSCLSCPLGQYTPLTNSTHCMRCDPNSYQTYAGADRCDLCDLNRYIRYGPANVSDSAIFCASCPALTSCATNGTISAGRGAYVLIDQTSGAIESVPCSPDACVGRQDSAAVATSAQVVGSSRLPVYNSCGMNRLPAYSRDDPDLAATDGCNVLCAQCVSGYSEVSGRCIACASTQWGALLALLLVLLLLVYALHRVPHDFTGSATWMIGTYFLQESTLFFAGSWMPLVPGLVQLQLFKDPESYWNAAVERSSDSSSLWYAAVCVVPLSDYGKVAVQLLSPLMAVAALGVVWAVHSTSGWLLQRYFSDAGRTRLHRAFEWLFQFDPTASHPRRFASAGLLSEEDGPRKEVEVPSSSSSSPGGSSFLYQRTLLRLAFICYAGVTLTCLRFFRLQAVGDFGSRVADFPQIAPAAAQYRALLPLVVLVLVLFVGGLPCALCAVMWRANRRGAIEHLHSGGAASSEVVSPTRQDVLLQQLVCMFQPRCWWYAPVLVGRRLLLALVLVLVVDPSVWAWLTLCNSAILALHAFTLPYRRRFDNHAELLCLSTLTLQTTLLSAYPPPITSAPLLAVLLALLLLSLAPLLYSVGLRCWLRLPHIGRPPLSQPLLLGVSDLPPYDRPMEL